MQNKYTDQYVIETIKEASDLAALEISKNYALDRLAENGVVTQQEVETIYALAHKVITEGADDLIPETLDIPEDVEEPEIAEAPEEGDDLDVSELEGIILPDAEGNQYVIQNGMIVPYEEDSGEEEEFVGNEGDEVDPDDGMNPADQAIPMEEEDPVEESTVPATETPLEESSIENIEDTKVITESENYSSNSSIVQRLIDDIKLR